MKNKHFRVPFMAASCFSIIICLLFTFVGYAYAEGRNNIFKFSDIDLYIEVPDTLACFTQNVTSNNSYLDKIGVSDVEEMRVKMQSNNVYLEVIPKDEVTYEFIVSGKKSNSTLKNFDELSDTELNDLFELYVDQYKDIENDLVNEHINSSSIETINDVNYFVTEVTSIANNLVTTNLLKYYTVKNDMIYTYSIQTIQPEITDDMRNQFSYILNTAQYMEIKGNILENPIVSEILNTIITLLIPILILALIVFLANRKHKKI